MPGQSIRFPFQEIQIREYGSDSVGVAEVVVAVAAVRKELLRPHHVAERLDQPAFNVRRALEAVAALRRLQSDFPIELCEREIGWNRAEGHFDGRDGTRADGDRR